MKLNKRYIPKKQPAVVAQPTFEPSIVTMRGIVWLNRLPGILTPLYPIWRTPKMRCYRTVGD